MERIAAGRGIQRVVGRIAVIQAEKDSVFHGDGYRPVGVFDSTFLLMTMIANRESVVKLNSGNCGIPSGRNGFLDRIRPGM